MSWAEEESVCRTETPEVSKEVPEISKEVRGVSVAFRRAICVVVEECLTDVEARMSQIENAVGIGVGRRSSGTLIPQRIFLLHLL